MPSVDGAILIGVAGLVAGALNTVVGSGTLITFPVLLSLGVPPVTANVSNAIGLAPGNLSGAWGYRRELSSQGRLMAWLGPASLVGALAGAVLLLVTSPGVFRTIVPTLIALALLLVVAQPALSRRLGGEGPILVTGPRLVLTWLVVLGTGVYGGYFGAAQGVLLVGSLGLLLNEGLQSVNALKNYLSAIVNVAAAILFMVFAHPDWAYVGIIAVTSAVGGHFGAIVGRHLSPTVLRGVIVVVGVTALVRWVF
jgi:uncharacterized membrane protein YfcA